jgi:hypothetical protein
MDRWEGELVQIYRILRAGNIRGKNPYLGTSVERGRSSGVVYIQQSLEARQ